MDGTGNQFLSRSRLTRNQHRRIGWGHFADFRKYPAERLRRSNDGFVHRKTVDLFAQSDVFIVRSLFGLLAILDIGCRRVPTNDFSRFVSQRIVMNQEPTILTIPAAHSSFVLEWNPSRERRNAFAAQSL